jgi:uncharacterized protein
LTEFTPLAAIVGGILIGLSAVMLMACSGRIAGMTSIVGGLIPPLAPGWTWRATFVAGAVLSPAIYVLSTDNLVEFAVPVSTLLLVVGGFIVGIGVTYGSGCTSGHGVCGIARFSPRSIVATAVFMASTFATVYVVRHVVGI